MPYLSIIQLIWILVHYRLFSPLAVICSSLVFEPEVIELMIGRRRMMMMMMAMAAPLIFTLIQMYFYNQQQIGGGETFIVEGGKMK